MKPNIIYILVDDMGYGDLSCLNPESKILTTHLDTMAARGLTCTDGHSSSAVCTPSRYSILTGRYNWRSWLKRGVTHGFDKPVIEEDRYTMGHMLKDAGYHTACIGKWHLGWDWVKNGEGDQDVDYTQPINNGPTTRGFDYFYGISASLDMAPYVYVENDRATALPTGWIEESPSPAYWRAGAIAEDFQHEEVLPNITRRAKQYIKDQAKAEQPFFLYFSLPAPHTPIVPTPEFQGKSGTNSYGDFCLMVDDVVGQVNAQLEASGIADNTIVVFTSDNGCSPQANYEELASYGHNPSYIFRGTKSDIYEGGHRIPLLIQWPALIPAGTVTDETVCLTDMMRTVADYLGIDLPDSAAEDSLSNLLVWRGERPDVPLREATVHHSIDGSFSIRQGEWKLEMCPGSGGWSYPTKDECEEMPPIQLYNLNTDIGERKNVYTEHPDVVEELKALLTDYIRKGRSTSGAPQQNFGGTYWEQLWWMHEDQG